MDLLRPPIARSLAGAPSADGLHTPSGAYLTGEEQLRITSIGNASGIVLTLRGRVLRPNFDIAITELPHTPNSNRTVATTTIALSEGWPLGFTVRASTGTPTSGAVWVLLELVRGQGSAAVVVETLGSGFVTANVPLQVPGAANCGPTDGAGCLRVIAGTSPGAGVEISETVPANARWQVLTFRYQLLTSATVANRQSALLADDGAVNLFYAGGDAVEAASGTYLYSYGTGFAPIAGGPTNALGRSLPSPIFLPAGARLKTQTINLQAGDQYSAVNYLVREWFDL